METLLGFPIEARAKKRCKMHLPGRYVASPLLQQEIAIGFPIRFSFRAALSPIGEFLFNDHDDGGKPHANFVALTIDDMGFGWFVEEVLTYRTLSCSKAKPYRKPYWDFPWKQGQKKDAKCIYQEGMSILEFFSPLVSTGNDIAIALGFQLGLALELL